MVYYNKDDLTNYSKGLGLNKVQAKNQKLKHYASGPEYIGEETESSGQEVSPGGRHRRRR